MRSSAILLINIRTIIQRILVSFRFLRPGAFSFLVDIFNQAFLLSFFQQRFLLRNLAQKENQCRCVC